MNISYETQVTFLICVIVFFLFVTFFMYGAIKDRQNEIDKMWKYIDKKRYIADSVDPEKQ